MTSPISIIALVVVITVNHATISAAVPRTNRHQDLTEAKLQGSLSESHIKPVMHRRKQHRKHEKKHRSQNIEKTSTKGHGKKHRRKLRRKHRKSEKGAKLNKSPLRKGKQSEFDDFRHCDYLDLVEVGCTLYIQLKVGHRQRSDFNCAPGGKFVFKVFSFILSI